MNMRRVESLLVAVLSVLPSVALAQGAIRGRVADAAGAPLTRATITADAPGLRATSDDQGRYEIRGVAPGVYQVRARLLGYQPKTARVAVEQTAVVQDFVLSEQPISLSPVDAVLSARGPTYADGPLPTCHQRIPQHARLQPSSKVRSLP